MAQQNFKPTKEQLITIWNTVCNHVFSIYTTEEAEKVIDSNNEINNYYSISIQPNISLVATYDSSTMDYIKDAKKVIKLIINGSIEYCNYELTKEEGIQLVENLSKLENDISHQVKLESIASETKTLEEFFEKIQYFQK